MASACSASSASGLLPVGAAEGEQLQLELDAASTSPATASFRARAGGIRTEVGGTGWARASDAVDAVRARFGPTSVGPAVTLGHTQGQRPNAAGVRPDPGGRRGAND